MGHFHFIIRHPFQGMQKSAMEVQKRKLCAFNLKKKHRYQETFVRQAEWTRPCTVRQRKGGTVGAVPTQGHSLVPHFPQEQNPRGMHL